MGNEFRVPKELEPVYNRISDITDKFCKEHLNDEFAILCRKLTAAISRKKKSPLLKKNETLWASIIVSTIGYINLLSKPEQKIQLKTQDVAEILNQKKRTVEDESRKLRQYMSIVQLDERFIAEFNKEEAGNPAARRVYFDRNMTVFVNQLVKITKLNK